MLPIRRSKQPQSVEPARLHITSNNALPSYSYVPGRFPHPISDPHGHSFGMVVFESIAPSASQWQECQSYLRGIDLFEHGFYWEAHEAWEAAWIACGRSGPAGDFLKALIKLSAAGVKAREGRSEGVRRHATRCVELLQSVSPKHDGTFFGLDIARLLLTGKQLAEAAEEVTRQATLDVTARLTILTVGMKSPH